MFYSNNSYTNSAVLEKANSIHKTGMTALTWPLQLIKTGSIQIFLLTFWAQCLNCTLERHLRYGPYPRNMQTKNLYEFLLLSLCECIQVESKKKKSKNKQKKPQQTKSLFPHFLLEHC